MGIEPTWLLFRGHTGFEAQDGASPTANEANDLGQTGKRGCTDGCRESGKTGPSSPVLARLIDLWPALPESVQQAISALADSGNPKTSDDERVRLVAEAVALVQSLEL